MMTDDEFEEWCKRHDWFYDYKDGDAYAKSYAERQMLIAEAQTSESKKAIFTKHHNLFLEKLESKIPY